MIGVAMFIHIYTYIYTYIYMFIIFTPMMAFILMLISLNIVCKAIVHHPQTHHINGFYKPSSDIGGSSFLFVPLFKDISFHVFFVCENMSFIAEQNFWMASDGRWCSKISGRSTLFMSHSWSGWWFGTFGWFFHSVENFIIPTDFHIFRGLVYHQPVILWHFLWPCSISMPWAGHSM